MYCGLVAARTSSSDKDLPVRIEITQKIKKIRNFKNVTNCLTSIPMYYYTIGNQEPGSNLLKAFFLEVMQRSTYSRKKESPPTSGALYQS